MSESGDYEPQDWGTGTSFADARAAYDADAGRSYDEAKARGVTASDVLPESLSTQSTKPFIVVPDLTGSMSDRPGVMFGKMPYMWNEIEKEYLGSDAEVAFVGVQDDGDNYPLQAQPFGQGEDLRVALAKLVIEGGGQGSLGRHERYDAAALYLCRNVQMPRAIRPTVIFIGDEEPYPNINPGLALRMAKVTIPKSMTVEEVFSELKRKYDVYFILGPYGRFAREVSEDIDSTTRGIQRAWNKILGDDHVSLLTDASRIVDVIFGILAEVSGRRTYFEKEIADRQTPAQVKTVMKSLATVHKIGGEPERKRLKGASRLKGEDA
ncbi:MAG TPA: hypothetical protein VJJ22_00215 [Candidatus Paceibacterota bacterium]